MSIIRRPVFLCHFFFCDQKRMIKALVLSLFNGDPIEIVVRAGKSYWWALSDFDCESDFELALMVSKKCIQRVHYERKMHISSGKTWFYAIEIILKQKYYINNRIFITITLFCISLLGKGLYQIVRSTFIIILRFSKNYIWCVIFFKESKIVYLSIFSCDTFLWKSLSKSNELFRKVEFSSLKGYSFLTFIYVCQ